MKLSIFPILIIVSYLCACQAIYQQYIPAPNEMPADLNFFANAYPIPEEQIMVQSTQNINPDILQAIMKTRGYIYNGYRVVKSQYSPSISAIKKAAHAIGSSNAIYFIQKQETVMEKKEKFDLNGLVGDLIRANRKYEYQNAFSRGLQTHQTFENVTYYTYYITYWRKTEDEIPILLNNNEIDLLKGEQESLGKKIKDIQNRMISLENQKKSISVNTATQLSYDNSALVAITSQLYELSKQIQQIKIYQEEIHIAIDKNDSHRKQMHFRDILGKP